MKHLLSTLPLLGCFMEAFSSDPYIPPRISDGKPDFTGVWQVLNTADYNLDPHGAQATIAMRATIWISG
jgi:hypothetical protein